MCVGRPQPLPIGLAKLAKRPYLKRVCAAGKKNDRRERQILLVLFHNDLVDRKRESGAVETESTRIQGGMNLKSAALTVSPFLPRVRRVQDSFL